MTYPPLLRALNSRNYRLFFAGQGISLVGNWMTNTAISWLAYELSNSIFIAGLLPFASQIPILLLGSLMGVVVDRTDRRRLLIAIQMLCLMLSATMAFATFTHHLSVSLLIGLATLRGLINAIEFPARQSFMVELVESKELLPNAIALNSSLFNVARLIGPSVAGAIMAFAGAAWCFVLDAASFLASGYALLAIQVPARKAQPDRKHPLHEFLDGLRYVRSHRALQAPLLLVPIVAFSGFAPTVLAPVYARDVFHGDARNLGLMLSAIGAGALASALLLGSRKTHHGLQVWVRNGTLLTGFSLIGFSFAPSMGIALGWLVLNGIGVVLAMAGANTLLQARVEDNMRGRVMGLFVMGQGLYPVGSLCIGSAATHIGTHYTLLCCAAITLSAALLFHHLGARSKPENH